MPLQFLQQTGWHVGYYFSTYSIEYRKTTDHGNADALSRLPFSPDPSFDGEEGDADMDTVCAIRTISLQLNPMDPGVLAKESAKDPVVAKVMLFTQEGWSPKAEPEDHYSVEIFSFTFKSSWLSAYTAPESSFHLAFNLKCWNSCIWVTSGCKGCVT